MLPDAFSGAVFALILTQPGGDKTFCVTIIASTRKVRGNLFGKLGDCFSLIKFGIAMTAFITGLGIIK
jgi:hypothetical protein